MSLHSPGQAFRAALAKENPLQIVGAINANHALLAQRAGVSGYLSFWRRRRRRARSDCRIWGFLRWMMC